MLKTRKLKYMLIALFIPLTLAVSCTPAQIEHFKSLPADQQAAVVWEIQQHQAAAAARAAARAQGPSLHPFLVCVRRHESDRGSYPHARGYQAQNPRSTASGAYQYLRSTWANVSRMAGYPGYAQAKHAPIHVQDAVTLYVINNPRQTGGRSNWNGTGC